MSDVRLTDRRPTERDWQMLAIALLTKMGGEAQLTAEDFMSLPAEGGISVSQSPDKVHMTFRLVSAEERTDAAVEDGDVEAPEAGAPVPGEDEDERRA